MNQDFGIKQWMALGVFSLAMTMAMSIGCTRDHNPLLATPPAGATQLTVTYLNGDFSQSPEIKMHFDVSTNLGPVTDLILGNIAILVDSKPEIPLQLVQDPLIPGRYTFTYRSRSTNSWDGGTWHGVYVSYGDLPVTYINP